MRGLPALGLVVALLLGGARPVVAQRVVLRIRPPIGDTLRMQMQQHFEISGDGASGDTETMDGTVWVWTHAVPLAREHDATDLVSVTDSVRITPPSAAMLPPLQRVQRALAGRTVPVRIASNGELRLTKNGTTDAVADVTPVLPTGAIVPGTEWTRNMRIPMATQGETNAVVHATFRLDSLGDGGAIAYVSLRGEMSHDHANDHDPNAAAHGQTTGSITGTLQLDRRLGWITDSRTVVVLSSLFEQPGRPAMHVRMRITQWLRALPAD